MVSFIMGVYNGADTLREAIESIVNQTYKDWELIACNDCSTDDTLSILNNYCKRDIRIKVISNSCNCGLAESLNRCMTVAQGEYIARMDCDDISDPHRLEKQVQYLETHPNVDLVGTYMQAFDNSGYLHVIQTKLKPNKYDLPKGAPFCHATILMKASVMRALNGYHVSKYTVRTEDVDLWYRFYAAGYIGENLPEPLYYVRLDEAAYKRRKLKYMLHASYLIFKGCSLLKLPFYYKIFCIKPIMSWIMPHKLKIWTRKLLIR